MDKTKTKMEIPVGAIIQGAGMLASTLGVGRDAADRRQLKQQEKLNELNVKTAKELADYEQSLKMKMWKDTNYGGILNEAKKAGVSKAAAIGGVVGGTQGASVGNVGGGNAATGVEGQRVQNEQLMMMAQLGNVIAQTKKTEAEVDNIKTDTDVKKTTQEGIISDNVIKDINAKTAQAIGVDYYERKARIEMQAANTENAKKIREFDTWMDTMFNKESMSFNIDAFGSYPSDENDLIKKVYKSGAGEVIQKLENLKKEGLLKDDEHAINEAEKTIREFKGDLASWGLNEVSASIITKILGLIFSRKK